MKELTAEPSRTIWKIREEAAPSRTIWKIKYYDASTGKLEIVFATTYITEAYELR